MKLKSLIKSLLYWAGAIAGMQVVANYPWLLLPVLFIISTVLCFNFFGDGMRDAADPYASR